MQEVERLCDSVVVVADGRAVAHGTVPELLERTGETDFEEAFVKLAFAPAKAPTAAGGRPMNRPFEAVATVLRKELVDALRDRRTLLTVLASSVLMGPLILETAISGLVASLEARAEQREVFVAGLGKCADAAQLFRAG